MTSSIYHYLFWGSLCGTVRGPWTRTQHENTDEEGCIGPWALVWDVVTPRVGRSSGRQCVHGNGKVLVKFAPIQTPISGPVDGTLPGPPSFTASCLSPLHCAADGWLGCNVGLHSGQALSGFAGPLERHEYFVLGPDVQMARLLQQWACHYGVDLLSTGATLAAAGNGVISRELDRVTYKGHSMTLSEVVQV